MAAEILPILISIASSCRINSSQAICNCNFSMLVLGIVWKPPMICIKFAVSFGSVCCYYRLIEYAVCTSICTNWIAQHGRVIQILLLTFNTRLVSLSWLCTEFSTCLSLKKCANIYQHYLIFTRQWSRFFSCILNELRQDLTQTRHLPCTCHFTMRFHQHTNECVCSHTGFTITLRVLNVQLNDVKEKELQSVRLKLLGCTGSSGCHFHCFHTHTEHCTHMRFSVTLVFRSWISFQLLMKACRYYAYTLYVHLLN